MQKVFAPGELRCCKSTGDAVTPVLTASREYIDSLGKAWHCLVPVQEDRNISTSFFQAQGIGLEIEISYSKPCHEARDEGP